LTEQPALEGSHRVALDSFGVVPAAYMEHAVDGEQAQLVGRGPADGAGVPASALVGLGDRALD
jgi:hypothetical protein